jgi:hypothetical protein
MKPRLTLPILFVATCLQGGCLERRLLITSEPAGALVSVNDVEVGRTPVEADFTFYGDYDVVLTKDGFEPLRERKTARAPVWEYPPFDLVASAVPATIEKEVKWHFVLQPALETTQTSQELEAGMLERARAVRGQITVPEPAPQPQ